jgi:hypothetical protein
MTAPRRGALIALAASLAIGALVLCGGGFGREIRPDTGADAYTRLVRAQFIDRPDRLVVRKDVDENAGVPVVDLAPAVYDGRDPEAWRFATKSFLLEDIRSNDPSIWVIENGRVKDINASAHHTPSPFAGQAAWRGAVLFRQPPETPRAQDVVLQPRAWNGPVIRLIANPGDLVTGDPRVPRLNLDRPPVGEISAPGVDVYCSAADLEPTALIRRVGDQAGVWAGTGAGSAHGCVARVGSTDLVARGFDALGRGDQVTFETPAHVYAYDRAEATVGEPALSTSTASGQRARDRSAVWWSVAIEHDYGRASRARVTDRSLRKDFRTSLDPVLQPAVQQMLDDFVRDHPGTNEIPIKIAAVTVMDAKTGEVLAMASYPHAKPSVHDVVDLDDDFAKAARVNQNLQLLPIGSAAKPLVSAGILVGWPELLTLRIPRRREASEILGLEMRRTIQGEVEGGTLDFNGFIQHSDNVYAANFLLLGSRDRGGQTCAVPAGDAYFIGTSTTPIHDRPKSVFERSDGKGGCTQTLPQSRRQFAWADDMAALFDVNVSARGQGMERLRATGCPGGLDRCCAWGGGRYGDDMHEASPWAALFEDRPSLDPCRFVDSSPVREALSIDVSRDFRADLVPIMLGNGEGRWTAVKVAEAYSRLVTGRRVSASFLPVPPRVFAPLDPRFVARIGLTHALTLVPTGTALHTDLPGALSTVDAQVRAAGLVPGFFAKTGTPVAIKTDYSPVDKTINLLISQGRVRYLAPGSVSVGPVANPVALTPNSDRQTLDRAVSALSRDRAFQEASARFHVRAGEVVSTLVGYTRAIAAGKHPFIVERNALLVRVGARREDDGNLSDNDMPHGKVLALVAAVYNPNRPVAPTGHPLTLDPLTHRAADAGPEPERAYTIVVTIQYPIRDRENAAADLAAAVLQRQLARRLATGRP